jgi:hypothetical protein
MPSVTRKNVVFALLAATTLHLTATGLFAGDLNPPAGAVGETMKTLDEVEPRTPISQADIPFQILKDGSYYLTESVRVANPGDAFVIRVGVDNVTLDLRGFTIFGATGGAQANYGILIEQGVENVTIRDGDIVTCGLAGLYAGETTDVRVLRVTSSDHGGYGFAMGTSSQLIDCVAHSNAADGFQTGDGCSLVRCVARNNFLTGITVGVGCRVTDSTANDNFGIGIYAFVNCVVTGSVANFNRVDGIAISGGKATDCMARGNTGNGFSGSGAFTSCVASSNGADGFSVTSASVLQNCSSSYNNIGFTLDDGSAALNCEAQSNSKQGFVVSNSTLEACSAHNNVLSGFMANRGNLTDCAATNNSLHGFEISGSYIKGSMAVANDGSGIEASNTNTIDGNHCRQNGFALGGYGISLTGSSNAVLRNVCGNNSTGQYNIGGAGNKNGAVTGTPATAGPWDNIAF